MRVLCVSPSYWPAFEIGGPVTALHGLNKALVRAGVDISVFTTNVRLKKIPNEQVKVIDGVKIKYFNYWNSLEFLGENGWQYSPQSWRSLRDNIETFDLVHITGIWNFPSTIALHYSARSGVPFIVSPHGSLAPDKISIKAWKKKLYYDLFIKKNLLCASGIHFFTQKEAEECLRYIQLEGKAIIVPNGVNLCDFDCLPKKETARAHYPFLQEKIVILYLGRIDRIKGLDILIESFANVARARPYVHLLLAGGGAKNYEDIIKQMIKSKDIQHRVTFTGMLSGQDKLEVLAACDIFVLPSYSEAFSMAILEAMASKLPVIITDKCHFNQVAEEKAGIVVVPNPKELSMAMETLIDSPEKCRRMGENARKLIEEKYTWDKVAGMMIKAYEDILRL